MFQSLQELVLGAGEGTISDFAIKRQCREKGEPVGAVLGKMYASLQVMREAVAAGLNPKVESVSGLTGGNASLLNKAVLSGKTAGGTLLGKAATRALATAEYNAAMGRIVAAPTAGACGILPAALMTMQDEYGATDDHLVQALFTAGAVGIVIAHRASVSGAQGGCQAECGSAAAMAAAAMVELRGGTAAQAADACGFALMNVLGLVCDPVHGLVEVPCVYRNVAGISNALVSCDLALSGIACPLPPDELIDAMKAVGDMLPSQLRETGEGGCAACPSAAQP